MSFQIRLAQDDDLPEIVAIFNQAIPRGVNDDTTPLVVADRQEWFNQFDGTHPLWVMTANDDQLIGWCALEYFYPHPAYLLSAEIAIYVHNDFQGQRLGRDLLEYVDNQIEKHLSLKTVIAYVYAENGPSQHLFRTCGYEQWGQLPQISKINGEMRTLLIFGKHFNQQR